jgi:hypothetical protein
MPLPEMAGDGLNCTSSGSVPPNDRSLSGLPRDVWRFLRSELDAMLALPSGAQKGLNETSTAI